jgi:hypothetical protein
MFYSKNELGESNLALEFYEYIDEYYRILKDRNGVIVKRKAKEKIPAKVDQKLWWKETYHLSIAFSILHGMPTPGWGCHENLHISYLQQFSKYRLLNSNTSTLQNKNKSLEFREQSMLGEPCEIKGMEKWTMDRKVMEAYNILNALENIDFYWSMVADHFKNKNIDELSLVDIRMGSPLRNFWKDEKNHAHPRIVNAQQRIMYSKTVFSEKNLDVTGSFQLSFDNYTKRSNEISSE